VQSGPALKPWPQDTTGVEGASRAFARHRQASLVAIGPANAIGDQAGRRTLGDRGGEPCRRGVDCKAMQTRPEEIAANLEAINKRIERACDAARRDPNEVTLIAVTKTVGVDDVRAAYDLGLRNFGESRLQESLPKLAALPPDVVWHFIGRLQSNKARKAAENFSCVHTLENEAQLREIDKARQKIDVLVEINIGDEPQKSGIQAKMLDEFVQTVAQYKMVRFRGLMTVGPAILNAELMRPYFQRMRELRESVGGEWLSMGMSQDFEVAIQEGATHVRIGTALFGERAHN